METNKPINIRTYIDAGLAKIKADLVIKNAQLINVCSSEIYPADVAIYADRIVATGDVEAYIGPDTSILDATGKYLAPGLIDGHLHIECSKLSITSFAKAVVPHGTTSIISGLDETLVTTGLDGLREIFAEIKASPLKVFWGAPFKTPYTFPESTVGFNMTPEVHAEVQQWPECFGVWEMVREFIQEKEENALGAIEVAQKTRLPVFGCAPMASGIDLNGYLCAGIRLDHESYDHVEAMEKIRKGMYMLIRESSVTSFLEENMKTVTEINPEVARRISFCTDDVTATDIMQNGHMDKLVRMTIAQGVDPIKAIQMATLNSAIAYRIDHLVGSIAPGKLADILIIDDPQCFQVEQVIVEGRPVAAAGRISIPLNPPERSAVLTGSMKADPVTVEQMKVRTELSSERVNVLAMHCSGEQAFVRKRRDVVLRNANGVVEPDVEQDVLYATVVERFGRNGNRPVAFCSGWKLKAGAMASSNAPDDNNIVCIGTNSEDMTIAINHLIAQGGGQVVVKDGEIQEFLSLPIGGIVCDMEPEEMVVREKAMNDAARALGCDLPDPFMYMFFLPITAIPDYALTDMGAIDCVSLTVFNPVMSEA